MTAIVSSQSGGKERRLPSERALLRGLSPPLPLFGEPRCSSHVALTLLIGFAFATVHGILSPSCFPIGYY